MESHRWFSVALKRACSEISWSYDVSAWCDVTGIIRSTMPSSCSTANHLSHRNVYLYLRNNTHQNSHYSHYLIFRYNQFITSSIRGKNYALHYQGIRKERCKQSYLVPVCKSSSRTLCKNQERSLPVPELSCHTRKYVNSPNRSLVPIKNFFKLPVGNP